MTELNVTEAGSVQFPMVRHAAEIGWKPLSPSDALAMRGGESGLLFRSVLEEALRRFNPWMVDEADRSVVENIQALPPTIEGNLNLPRRREQRVTQVAHEGSVDGPLYGETIVFTGALSEPRGELVRQAVEWGCDYKPNMSKKVTMLVVGTQDERKLQGHGKSSKHRRAEELIRKGHDIRTLTEDDFWHLKETVNL